jgi:hypothetical protein
MPLDPIEIIGGLAIGEGLGGAIADTVEPRLQSFKNGQWSDHQDVPLNAALAAEVAAENFSSFGAMATEASFTGYDGARFQHLYDVTLSAPGAGELLNMLRRGTINPGNFTHGLRKARLEPMWDDALADLQHVYIGLGDIATAIVRGAVPAPSWVPVAPPTHTDNVPRFPVTNIDPITLAGKLGYSEDMLRIMTARSGLSLAPILATQALFRGKLTHNDWLLAIAEGDLRTEWAETLREAARSIPSPGNFVQEHLRGWVDAQAMYAGTARHGMTQADTDVLYQIERRPLNPHAITTGLARGGNFNPQPGGLTDPYEASVHQADLGPEWYDLAIANKYLYPSAFVLRSLAQAGDLGGQPQVEQVLLEIGWKPSFASTVSKAWTAAGTVKVDPHVAKAQTTLYTEAHKAYVKVGLDRAQVTPALNALAVPAAAQAEVFSLWDMEKQLAAEAPPA